MLVNFLDLYEDYSMISFKIILALILHIIALIVCAENSNPDCDATNGCDDDRGETQYCNDNLSKRSPILNPGVMPDARTLDELYKLALAEGGKLIVYAGGDAPNQQDSNRAGFEAAFPGIQVEMIVDFSKYHDARIDYQLRSDTLVVDVAQLQTLQDFPRWRDEGALLNYKPIGWEHIYDELKDPEGAFTGVFIDAFTTNVNTELLPNKSSWPVEANDYLKPEFKDKLVVTYPNDDDAVLFWFKQVVDKYGITYLEKFKAQNPKFVRGTATAIAIVANSSQGFVATMSADGGLNSQDKYGTSLPKLILPERDPFVMWAQTAAIFNKAKHPETAKLYISWLVDKQQQEQPQAWSWSVRDDVPVPATFKSIWDYPNGNPTAFIKFMKNREAVEIFRNQIGLIFGQVEGRNPNEPDKAFGMYPVIGYRSAITVNTTSIENTTTTVSATPTTSIENATTTVSVTPTTAET